MEAEGSGSKCQRRLPSSSRARLLVIGGRLTSPCSCARAVVLQLERRPFFFRECTLQQAHPAAQPRPRKLPGISSRDRSHIRHGWVRRPPSNLPSPLPLTAEPQTISSRVPRARAAPAEATGEGVPRGKPLPALAWRPPLARSGRGTAARSSTVPRLTRGIAPHSSSATWSTTASCRASTTSRPSRSRGARRAA